MMLKDPGKSIWKEYLESKVGNLSAGKKSSRWAKSHACYPVTVSLHQTADIGACSWQEEIFIFLELGTRIHFFITGVLNDEIQSRQRSRTYNKTRELTERARIYCALTRTCRNCWFLGSTISRFTIVDPNAYTILRLSFNKMIPLITEPEIY